MMGPDGAAPPPDPGAPQPAGAGLPKPKDEEASVELAAKSLDAVQITLKGWTEEDAVFVNASIVTALRQVAVFNYKLQEKNQVGKVEPVENVRVKSISAIETGRARPAEGQSKRKRDFVIVWYVPKEL